MTAAGREMSTEEKVARRVARKAADIARKYPLLEAAGVVEHWKETPEQAQQFYRNIDRYRDEIWPRKQAERLADDLETCERLRRMAVALTDEATVKLLTANSLPNSGLGLDKWPYYMRWRYREFIEGFLSGERWTCPVCGAVGFHPLGWKCNMTKQQCCSLRCAGKLDPRLVAARPDLRDAP